PVGLLTAAVSRRTALRLAASSAGVAFVAACGVAPAAPASPPATVTVADTGKPAAAAAQPRTGETLRVAIPADITSLDGHISSSNLSVTTSNIFDRLVACDIKLQPQPMLAESWNVSSDFKRLKLNLRKGVQWHTGRELSADDVKYNLLRGRDPK